MTFLRTLLLLAFFIVLPMSSNAWDSFGEQQNFISSSAFPANMCSGRIVNPADLDNQYLPNALGPQNASSNQTDWALMFGVTAGLVYMTGGAPTIAAYAANMLILCTWSFPISPPEKIMMEIGDIGCCANDKSICTEVTDAHGDQIQLTVNNIPYYYHCNPMYEPFIGRELNPGDPDEVKYIGRTTGYEGFTGKCNTFVPYSQLGTSNTAASWARPTYINSIWVGYQNGLAAGFGNFLNSFGVSAYDYCSLNPMSGVNTNLTQLSIGGGMKSVDGINQAVAYYKMDNSGIKICAAAITTGIPIEIGCNPTAPPAENLGIDEYLLNYFAGTRCAYFTQARNDLMAVASSIAPVNNGRSVVNFLNGDFHFISTTVGCIKDMMLKIVYINNFNNLSAMSFFQQAQLRLAPLIWALLTLSVALFGVKMITSPQPLPKGELIMTLIKFSLVIYFCVGAGWYSTSPNLPGVFPLMMDFTEDLADIFLQTQTNRDPNGFCFYNYNGYNILSNNLLPLAPATYGFDVPPTVGVKLSVWDLIDCKIASYLSFGSCNYSLGGGIIAFVLIVPFMFIQPAIAIMAMLYTIMIMWTIFKYIHISILSMVIVTLLVFVSPILIPLAMFEKTKEVFKAWATQLLGYLIYPSILFAFFSLMLATFDTVYYGNINMGNIDYSNPVTFQFNADATNFKTACTNVDSIFCYFVTNYKQAPLGNFCTESLVDAIWASNFKTVNMIVFKFTKGQWENPGLLIASLGKLLAFAFIFYLLSSSVAELIEQALLKLGGGVYSHSRGQVSMVGAYKSMTGLYASAAKKGTEGAAKGVKKAFGKKDDKGGEGGGEGGGG